ncbi:MAG: hypothetical protein IT433_09215 [Phycisphaerales bacterium]|nr:hypothetical protein [Phycisphaerales bacterium]
MHTPSLLVARRRRAFLVALLMLTLLWASSTRSVTLTFEGGLCASLSQGTLRLGSQRPPSTIYGYARLETCSSWSDSISLAWRPYRFDDSITRGIAIPLWIPTLAAALWAAFQQGRLSAMPSAPASPCLACGYNLATLPHGNRPPRCPECGQLHNPVPC